MTWESITAPAPYPSSATTDGTSAYLLTSDGGAAVVAYDPTEDTYDTLPAPTGVGYGSQIVWVPDLDGDPALVIVGYDDASAPMAQALQPISGAGTWTALTAPTVPRSEFAILAHDGQVFVAGGQDVTDVYTDSVEILDLAAGTWSAGPSLPAAAYGIDGARSGSQWYVFGYIDNLDYVPGGFVLDLDGLSWSTLEVPYGNDSATHAAVIGLGDGRIVVAGGYGPLQTDAAYQYDPLGDRWSQLDSAPFADAMVGVGRGVTAYVWAQDSALAARLVVPSLSSIELSLYALGDDLTVPGVALTGALKPSFEAMLSESGAGSFDLKNDDAAWESFARDGTDVVAVDVLGARRFALLVEQLARKTVDQNEEVGQVTSFSGRGHLACLSRALVYPALGVDRHPVEEDRQFNWTSPVYDDSGWDASVLIDDVGGAKSDWPIPWAEDFPDDTAEILWAPYFLPDFAATGEVYFHQRFTATQAGRHIIFATADNYAEVYIDGALVITVSGNNGFGFTHAQQIDVDLDVGEHLVAIVGTNLPLGGGGVNPAGIAWAIYVPGYPPDLVAHSDASECTIVGYPSEPPGMTPGEVMRLAVEEAQARGEISYVTLGFDDTNDSNGNPWPVVADIATKVGTDLLTFFREIAGTYVDLYMPPDGYELRAYNIDERGTSSGVEFAAPADGGQAISLDHQLNLGRVNKELVRWGGGWSEESAGDGDFPALLGLGALSSRAEVQRVAQGQLDVFADPREQITVEIEPRDASETPFLAFDVGDTVTCPLVDGTPDEVRVITIGVTEEGTTGRPLYSTTVKDLILGTQERFVQAIKKMENGTIGGYSKVAQPVVPTYVPRGLVPAGARVSSPYFELTDSGTDSGTGTRSLGSVTIGGEDAGTYYILAVEYARSSNMSNKALDPTHGGASISMLNHVGPPGQAMGRAVYLVTPGGTPTLDSFDIDPNNTGTIHYAWMLVKVVNAGGAPTLGFQGGGIGTTSYTLTDAEFHADAGVGVLSFLFSFSSNVTAYTQTLTWGGDVAPNALTPVANPIGWCYLDAAFYPSSSEPARTDLQVAGSVTTSTSALKGSLPVNLLIPGV